MKLVDKTLCFLVKKYKNKITHVLLGMKRKGFGKNLYAGIGGKVGDKIEETVYGAVIRETKEEIGIDVKHMIKVAEVVFLFSNKESWNQKVHVFLADKWQGGISESDEMIPEWFNVENIPYDKMWEDAKYWLPRILNNEKLKLTITYNDEIKVIENNIKEEKLGE